MVGKLWKKILRFFGYRTAIVQYSYTKDKSRAYKRRNGQVKFFCRNEADLTKKVNYFSLTHSEIHNFKIEKIERED